MSKRQTRKSISIRGVTYTRLKAFCDDEKVAVSQLIEELIAAKLGYKPPARRFVPPPPANNVVPIKPADPVAVADVSPLRPPDEDNEG